MNAFESGSRKCIPACLVYLFRKLASGERAILMIHRDGRPGDYHSGKWNGLGGKFEPGESPWQAASREVFEEAGLLLPEDQYRWLGTLQFPLFKPHKNEDWWCVVLTAQLDEPIAERVSNGDRLSDEGALYWVPVSKVIDLPLWEGDRQFLPHVLSGQVFQGTLWYEGQSLKRSVLR